jgi:glycosyltransferase involved in cell wall biosynthesis
MSRGYPIDLLPKTGFKALVKFYGQAKIYWHATGYGTNELDNPQAQEHFGIATIEAMAAGAVPVVINQGGQPEIVKTGSGCLWQTQAELIDKTLSLVNNDNLRLKMSRAAQMRAKAFSLAKFCRQAQQIFKL